MINIACFDLEGSIREEFKKIPFINDSSNIKFFSETNDKIYELFSREAIDIFLVVDDERHVSSYDFVCHLKENHPEIQIIFVSNKSDFKSVRTAFLYGISDYILLPLDFFQVEETINNLLLNHTDFYLSKKILDKLDGMLKFIFKGGENINDYIDSLVNMVFTDFSDNFSRQTVVEKIKFTSYKSMIARKPGLKNFFTKKTTQKKSALT
jgi:response regulator of citrate/malate metabolism